MTDRIDSPVESTNDGVVVELARDDLERKRFLKMAGRGIGAGAAATALAVWVPGALDPGERALAQLAQHLSRCLSALWFQCRLIVWR